MSLWTRVNDTLHSVAKQGRKASDIVDGLRKANRQVTFAVALVSLGAKLAKADGQVTVDEIQVFKTVFRISKADERKVGKVFDLAKETVAGFETYAAAVARLYKDDERVRDDVMEGLFQIAAADGDITPPEEAYLRRVNEIFSLRAGSFQLRLDRFSAGDAQSPYVILGLDPSSPTGEVRLRWKELVRANHPDIVMARGAPPEAAKLAENRVADYNCAWDEIKASRGL